MGETIQEIVDKWDEGELTAAEAVSKLKALGLWEEAMMRVLREVYE